MSIIVKTQGGLGNQLFQFAFGQALSYRTKQNLYLDLNSFENTNRKLGLDKFNIHFTEVPTTTINTYFTVKNRIINKYLPNSFFNKKLVHFESTSGFYDVPVNLKGDSYYQGYWQNELYFSNIDLMLKDQFTLKGSLSDSKLLTIIKNNETVAVHIRRGDYLHADILNVHGIVSLDYYYQAIKMITDKIPAAIFIIFSDDIEWVKSNLKLQYNWIIADTSYQYTDEETMILMSMCNHQIIANSTFSWWAAWLNNNSDKRIIAPKKWFAHNANNASVIPNSWTIL